MLKICAGPHCANLEDPRWGGFCDGCGCATEEDREHLLAGWRLANVRFERACILLRQALPKADPSLARAIEVFLAVGE